MSKKRAFTLIELIVVMAIISLLAATLVPQVSKAMDKTRVARTAQELTLISNAMDAYLADVGSYPPEVEVTCGGWGCEVGLVDRGNVHSNHVSAWSGPYLKSWPKRTAWGGIVGCGATGAYYIHPPIGWINRDGIGGNDRWIHMNANCVRYPDGMMSEVDKVLDDGEGENGNVRVYMWGSSFGYLYYYIGEGASDW